MKIIPRYVRQSLLSTTLLMFIAFTFLFIVIATGYRGAIGQIPHQALPLALLYLLPFALSYTPQITVIFTVVLVYVTIHQRREKVALQSSGISTWRIMVPAFWMGAFLTVFAICMGEVYNAWGVQKMNGLISTNIEHFIQGTLKQKKSLTFDEYEINVNDVLMDGTLQGVSIFKNPNSPTERQQISARTAKIQFRTAGEIWKDPEEETNSVLNKSYRPASPDEHLIKITFYDIKVVSGDYNATFPNGNILYIPANQLPNADLLNKGLQSGPSSMSLASLNEYIADHEKRIDALRDRMAIITTQQLLFGNCEHWGSYEWRWMYDELGDHQQKIQRARLEPYRRLGVGFGTFVFVWIGVPIALRQGERNMLMIMTIVMFLLVAYYLVYLLFMNLAKAGAVPPSFMFIPGILNLIFGVYLIRKAL